MAFQATIPSIGAIAISPDIIAISQQITISVPVTEITTTVDYVWPYSGEMYSGEEVRPWP